MTDSQFWGYRMLVILRYRRVTILMVLPRGCHKDRLGTLSSQDGGSSAFAARQMHRN